MMPVLRVDQAVERYQMMKQYVQEVLVDGTDYGAIPGTKRPDGSEQKVLLKPGAEKLCTIFGLTKRFTVVESVEDWQGAAHGGEPFFYYLYRASVYRGDVLIAEADGSCNSWETKYRYRNAQKACPACGATAIMKSKYPPRNNPNAEPGWYCYAKAGGCGAEFGARDAAIVDQVTGKIPNPDPADVVNTVMKMAQKRALVAVTLLAVNASDYFTQDLDDADEAPPPAPAEEPKPAARNGGGGTATVEAAREQLARSPREIPKLQELYSSWTNEVKRALAPEFGDVMAEARKFAGESSSNGNGSAKPPPEAPPPDGKRAQRTPGETLTFLQSVALDGQTASDRKVGLLASKMEELWAGDAMAKMHRYDVLRVVYHVESAKDLDEAQASALLDLILSGVRDSSGDYPLDPIGAAEVRALYEEIALIQASGDESVDVPA